MQKQGAVIALLFNVPMRTKLAQGGCDHQRNFAALSAG